MADPSISLSLASSRGSVVQVLARNEVTPLFSCMKVDKSWFTRAKVVPVRGAGGPDDLPFVRTTLSELLGS